MQFTKIIPQIPTLTDYDNRRKYWFYTI